MEAGMGWPAALDLERLRPARMSQRPTSFSSDIISRSLCKPSGSRLSLILPCNRTNPCRPYFLQLNHSLSLLAQLVDLYTRMMSRMPYLEKEGCLRDDTNCSA